uniref:SEA domain-containing protein n=1 Tax=Magallana gigas TaxID=29159 RepID=A0A8W8IUP0_MAGGI|nr:serine-rich adhesin for platelets-like isoform X3 [Crassostrea gigas]
MDLYFLNKDKIANFQREGLKYDVKIPIYLQGSTSLQVKRQKPREDQDSNKEWINTVTSDEFKREFFNHTARISVSFLKQKHTCKDEEYIPSEYSLSSDGNKQTKYKAIVIAVLFISCLMVLAVSGAIVFIFRHSNQNNKKPKEDNSTLNSNKNSSTTLNIIKSSTLPGWTSSGNPSTLTPSRTKTKVLLTTASKEDSSLAEVSSETSKSMTMTTLSPYSSYESITTDVSNSDTVSFAGLQVTTTYKVNLSNKISSFFTSFQAKTLTTIDSTASTDNTNTNTVFPSALEKSSHTETTTTTGTSDQLAQSNDTNSFAVITDTSTKTISDKSKEISTSTYAETISIVPIQRTSTSETRIPTTVTIQIPSPEKQLIPHLRNESNTETIHPATSTFLEPFTTEENDYYN